MTDISTHQNDQMLWRKSYFRSLWGSALPLETRFSLSRNLFVGREAFIFAGGPSLRRVDLEALNYRLKDSLVLCIKQTIDVVGPGCDALLMNFCNFSSYDWTAIKCPVFWTTFDPSHSDLIRARNARTDATFEVVDNGANDATGFSLSTAGRESWNDLHLIKDGHVRWGPGLMYELAIPLALHAGVSHIYLVAWDIGRIRDDTSGSFMNEHFYDSTRQEIRTNITNLEIQTVAASTKGLKKWLESKGIGVSVVSDQSLVDKDVMREMQWIKP